MKKVVNIRLIEKSIQFFLKQKNQKQNNLLKFAGILDDKQADDILKNIQDSKNSNCIANNKKLSTNNLKHFERIDNLQIVKWL